MNCSFYVHISAWLCVYCSPHSPLTVNSSVFLFSLAVWKGKKRLELIPFLIWRKKGTKDPKTIEFLELHGRVLSLILSRYVSDSVLTIVKICWRGIHAKSFRVQQSLVDTRLVNFLVNRNVFLLLLVEICAIFFSFFWSSKDVHSGAFAFHSHESFRVSDYDFIATRCR